MWTLQNPQNRIPSKNHKSNPAVRERLYNALKKTVNDLDEPKPETILNLTDPNQFPSLLDSKPNYTVETPENVAPERQMQPHVSNMATNPPKNAYGPTRFTLNSKAAEINYVNETEFEQDGHDFFAECEKLETQMDKCFYNAKEDAICAALRSMDANFYIFESQNDITLLCNGDFHERMEIMSKFMGVKTFFEQGNMNEWVSFDSEVETAIQKEEFVLQSQQCFYNGCHNNVNGAHYWNGMHEYNSSWRFT